MPQPEALRLPQALAIDCHSGIVVIKPVQKKKKKKKQQNIFIRNGVLPPQIISYIQ